MLGFISFSTTYRAERWKTLISLLGPSVFVQAFINCEVPFPTQNGMLISLEGELQRKVEGRVPLERHVSRFLQHILHCLCSR